MRAASDSDADADEDSAEVDQGFARQIADGIADDDGGDSLADHIDDGGSDSDEVAGRSEDIDFEVDVRDPEVPILGNIAEHQFVLTECQRPAPTIPGPAPSTSR
ncbi:MAG: hypothetical protein K0U84_11950 [Actinomycetia bacterium]|nr:hypothetical protein [Actinomycetes bacterium]